MNVSRVETRIAAVTCPLIPHLDRKIGRKIMVEMRGIAKDISSWESWRKALQRRKTTNATAAPPKQLKFSSENMDFRAKNEVEDGTKVTAKVTTSSTKWGSFLNRIRTMVQAKTIRFDGTKAFPNHSAFRFRSDIVCLLTTV